MSDFKLKWIGDEVADNVEQSIQKALPKAGLFLKSKSIPEAPKDMGDLRSSCIVDVSKVKKGVVSVGYGEEYALKQHENLEYKHSTGKAKFLEDPYNKYKKKLQDFIANAVTEVTGD